MSVIESGKKILQGLIAAGFEAYFVGGCVRDYYLNRQINDIDITTSAPPERIQGLFDETRPTGILYGTVTVLMDGFSFEVTSFRGEGGYQDGRRPQQVTFGVSLIEDLLRRDITINAMAMTLEGDLIDHVGGLDDLRGQIIRCVGNPLLRLNEDRLRKLRLVRFAAQLGFEIEEVTYQALVENPSMADVSVERVLIELDKLLCSDFPLKGLEVLAATGLLAETMPELLPMLTCDQVHPYHHEDVWHHSLRVVSLTPAQRILRWAALLHDCGKPLTKASDSEGHDHFYGHHKMSEVLAKDLLTRLKMDRQRIACICHLIKHHMYWPDHQEKAIRKWFSKIGLDHIENMLDLMNADRMAHDQAHQAPEAWTALTSLIEKVQSQKPALTRKDLVLKGHDLIMMDERLKENHRLLGPLLTYLLNQVLADPDLNTKDHLRRLTTAWLDHPQL